MYETTKTLSKVSSLCTIFLANWIKMAIKQSNQNLVFHFYWCEIFPPLCSTLSFLTEWLDVWLGTDLNTKKYFPSLGSKFQAITHLLGVTHCRVTQLESRTEEALYKGKNIPSVSPHKEFLKNVLPPRRPGVVCLIQGLFSSHWQTGKEVAGSCCWVSEELPQADAGFA